MLHLTNENNIVDIEAPDSQGRYLSIYMYFGFNTNFTTRNSFQPVTQLSQSESIDPAGLRFDEASGGYK